VFQRVYETGIAVKSVELQFTRPDGSVSHVDLSVSPVRAVNGETAGYRGIVRDVSDRIKTESLLHRRISLLAVLQQVDVELNQTLELDPVLDVARNAARILSAADAGYIGLIEDGQLRLARAIGSYKDGALIAPVGAAARALERGNPEWTHEESPSQIAIPLLAHHKLMGLLVLEATDAACFTPEMFEFAQLLASRIATAIENARLYQTSQQQLTELQTLYAQVTALEDMKTDMIRMAAHDIRSPLAIIFSYTDMLTEDLAPHLGEAQMMYINAIRQAVDRISRMSSDILTLEKVQEKFSVPDLPVSLGMLLERAVDEHADESRSKRQTVTLSVPEPTIAVLGEGTELLEAVENLISNAIKYTPNGGGIHARAVRDGDHALVEVEDSGFGVPDDEQPRLFQPFQRIKTQETRGIDGTGLGLYIVKKIVERHGGDVFFRSVYHQGSTFGFRLPLAPEFVKT
jgi:signal transduction histidine kinase